VSYDIRVNAGEVRKAAEEFRNLGRAAREAETDISRSTIGSRALSGPASRLQTAQANAMVVRQGGGDAAARFDTEHGLLRAQKAMAKAEREIAGPEAKSFGQRALGALTSSRFGAGGLQPLVGQVAGLLGPEATVIAGAAAGFAEMMRQATERTREFTQAATVSGGRTGDIARLSAAGIGPGQAAGAAARLQEALSSNPRAIMMAGRLGIEAQPDRMLADPNQAKLLMRTLN
jgi:hypothetical protein